MNLKVFDFLCPSDTTAGPLTGHRKSIKGPAVVSDEVVGPVHGLLFLVALGLVVGEGA